MHTLTIRNRLACAFSTGLALLLLYFLPDQLITTSKE